MTIHKKILATGVICLFLGTNLTFSTGDEAFNIAKSMFVRAFRRNLEHMTPEQKNAFEKEARKILDSNYDFENQTFKLFEATLFFAESSVR
ncbi:hypothetical protein KAW80_03735 [Candidatus Babeliales bacterium]|nr:hypothetical protein [Candidatus Babeliales bacterium]